MSKIPPQQEFPFGGADKIPAPPQFKPIPAANDSSLPPQQMQHDVVTKGHGPLRKLMDYNFIQYASYVICDRAIPTMEDGLKPVQRRILHSLFEKDDGRFIKVANVVGHCMQYHPHGDASIADALVTLANKEYLIERQGNFGNILTGDRAAASRYIECRLTELARKEIFNNDLTTFVPSYDGRNQEPVLLPCKLPLLLMLGAEGIAVGLSTKILPYNFNELIEAQIAILQKKPFKIYPDFQQGGLIDVSEYDNGLGKVKIRALIEEKKGQSRLIVKELPFGVTTESLISSVEDAINKNKVPVRAINDFTSEHVELELVLSPGTDRDKALSALFAFTNCEVSITSRVIVIRKNKPVEATITEILHDNTEQLLDILKRELELKRNNLLDEFHNKTLVQIFIENRIYKKIEKCKSYEGVLAAVKEGLEPFRNQLRRDIINDDIEMLLGVRIRRISLFDINKNKKDIEDILTNISEVEKNLGTLKKYAVNYLKSLLAKYGSLYPRHTKISAFENIEVKELTAEELEIKCDKQNGYIGYNVDGAPLFRCSSLDKLVIVSQDGSYRVIPPPDKFFVDKMMYCEIYDRDKVMTAVYKHKDFLYMKRFTFGGTIMNKEYSLAIEGSKVLVFKDDDPAEIYVKYKPAKGQRKHKELFKPKEMPVKGVKARGNQMTFKAIAAISVGKPSWWDSEPE